MVAPRSFEEIRLPFLPGNFGGTRAAEAGASFCNDNTPRLRTFCLDALRLVGRIALAQLRSVAQPCRAIATTFDPQSIFMCQRVPSAVCVVAYPLSVGAGHPALSVLAAVDGHSTARGEAGVPQLLGGARVCAGL